MVDSPHTLTTRHKASLQKFIEKNDWIQTKIELLESSDLPAIDTDEALLDEDVLSRLIHEHDRIEAEVQELDNGELRALRLLAKGEFHCRGVNTIIGSLCDCRNAQTADAQCPMQRLLRTGICRRRIQI